MNGQSFANASIVSGFDFPEDGRAIALTDWDGDGDQDFWVACRTAPQLRLMQNQTGSEHNWIQIELRGITSNRDAIGSRVFVQMNDGQTLQRTLRCGEGFLSCQSKRLNFGLGTATGVRDIKVKWPNGKLQEFGSPSGVNQRIRLVEGQQTIEPCQIATSSVKDGGQVNSPEQTMATHNLLASASPVPPLIYKRRDGQTCDASTEVAKPRLINLWASWCQPCKLELQEWREAKLSQQLDVLVLSVDEVNDATSTDSAMDWLSRAGYETSSGLATAELLDTLQALHNVIYDHHRPLPVPASFLLDKHGWLRAVYKGTVPPERILADLKAIEKGRRLGDTLPFPGNWLGPQSTHNLSLLTQELHQQGYSDFAASLVDRMEASLSEDSGLAGRVISARLFLAEQLAEKQPQSALEQVRAVLKIDPNQPAAHERAALILARAGQQQAAATHFQAALRHYQTPKARTHFNYGQLLRKSGQASLAAQQFQKSLLIDPKFAEAHQQLGLIAASSKNFPVATRFFGEAVKLRPKSHLFRVNLAMALSQQQLSEAAWQAIQPILGEKDVAPMALLLGARSLGELKRYNEAIPLLERFLEVEPDAKDVREQLNLMRKEAQLPQN